MFERQYEVEPGIHTITASAPGYITQQKTVDVQSDMTVTMRLQPSTVVNSGFGSIIGIGLAALAILLLVLFLTRDDSNGI